MRQIKEAYMPIGKEEHHPDQQQHLEKEPHQNDVQHPGGERQPHIKPQDSVGFYLHLFNLDDITRKKG